MRPGLGINILSDQIAAQQKIDGVVVLGVAPGGAAEKAGIRGTRPAQGGWQLGDVIVEDRRDRGSRDRATCSARSTHTRWETKSISRSSSRAHGATVKVTLQPIP